MRGRLSRVLTLALAWAALAGQARADAVAPPPDRCPTGSVPVELCHGAPTCRAHTCESDVECGAGMVCRATRLCTVEHCCSGQCCAIDCGSEPTTYTHVLGPCGGGPGDTPCADFGAACTEQRVCVPGTPDAGSGGADGGGSTAADAGRRDAGTTGGPSGGGGCCSVAGRRSALGSGAFAAAVVVAALAPLVRRARRRTRSRRSS